MLKKSNFFERVCALFKLEFDYDQRQVAFNKSTFSIREVKYTDIKKLIAIEREAYHGDVPWGRSAFLEEMNGPHPILYILAEQDNKVVGFLGVRFVATDGHITNVAVLNKYQNQGIGRFFIEEAIRVAKERNYLTLSLEVRISNLDAQRLYRRLGFVSQRVKPNYYRSNNEDALDMLLTLEE